jgi:arginyl-tRNA synthetase
LATGKFSTRRGMTIHLEDVLNEAIARAREMMMKAGVAKDLPPQEQAKITQAVGIGGIKYNDLKQNPRTDIVFDWDQILTLSGNSGPYLQYTFARTQSVLHKAKNLNLKFEILNLKLSPEEQRLLRTFYRFPEAVEEAAKAYSPNLLCNFLFDLAQKFNLFYDKQRIIGSANEEFRLVLTAAVGQVLKNGLGLLGITTLERM